MNIRGVIILGLCLFMSTLSFAQSPNSSAVSNQSQVEVVIEQRARVVGKSLRCVVCQNQSIENSNAPLAADMRALVRERIRAGDSDADIIALMRDRYGDFVLLKPPLQLNTILLWGAPLGVLVGALIWYAFTSRKPRKVAQITPLSEDEQKQLEALLHKPETES